MQLHQGPKVLAYHLPVWHAVLLCMQPQITLAYFLSRASSCLTYCPLSLFCFPGLSLSFWIAVFWIISPRCINFHFPRLSLTLLFPAHIYNPSRSLCITSTASPVHFKLFGPNYGESGDEPASESRNSASHLQKPIQVTTLLAFVGYSTTQWVNKPSFLFLAYLCGYHDKLCSGLLVA